MSTNESPRLAGYRWPAEWESHDATWIAWPHNEATWPGVMSRIREDFTRLVSVIAESDPVYILAGNAEVMRDAERRVGRLSQVTLVDIETNDAWCRDHGPTFLVHPKRRELAIVDWRYNAWGEKYPPFDKDQVVAGSIANRLGCRRFTPDLIMEGGAIEGNGRGVVLTTLSCLKSRNRALGVSEIEGILRDHLGVRHIVWLPGGELAGDDTDGHVDQLARFVSDSIVVVAEDGVDTDSSKTIEQTLETVACANEISIDVLPLPSPDPIMLNKCRLPASYCNFYIANQLVVVPQFDVPQDKWALGKLREVFPNREVVGLSARNIVAGLGAFHCLTQQQPATGD